MFNQLLESITNKVEGTLGAIVMGMDGISIEKRLPAGDTNIEAMAAEYTSLLKASSTAAQEIGQGPLEELIVSTDSSLITIRMITPEYFLLLLLNKDGNLGRARFELKKAKHVLARELVI
ncbi:MAG: GTPase [Acidobacteria bacterium]|nr:MAG: GTPase [Acidobacteriota bacterium]